MYLNFVVVRFGAIAAGSSEQQFRPFPLCPESGGWFFRRGLDRDSWSTVATNSGPTQGNTYQPRPVPFVPTSPLEPDRISDVGLTPKYCGTLRPIRVYAWRFHRPCRSPMRKHARGVTDQSKLGHGLTGTWTWTRGRRQ